MLVSAVAALMVALPQSTPARPSVRFHHFHFRVNEPAAAMNAGMATLEGSRVLLRGLGVGVRVGREYALFDRAEAPERSDGGPPVDAAYAVARDWLRGMGVEVTDLDEAVRAKLAATFGRDDLDHVAFAAADTSAAIAALIARGARATRKTDASTFFRASDSCAPGRTSMPCTHLSSVKLDGISKYSYSTNPSPTGRCLRQNATTRPSRPRWARVGRVRARR